VAFRTRGGNGPMSFWQSLVKRALDVGFSLVGLLVCSVPILICWVLAAMETGRNGFFLQERVGRFGKEFKIVKIRTMKSSQERLTSVTTLYDARITPIGRVFRKFKLDELPQLLNVLLGQMSFVGPRPDVPGFADQLEGDDRIVLSVRPGITSPAAIACRDEEKLLSFQENPEEFNRKILFPWKTRLNRDYVENFSLGKDFVYLAATLIPCLGRKISSGKFPGRGDGLGRKREDRMGRNEG